MKARAGLAFPTNVKILQTRTDGTLIRETSVKNRVLKQYGLYSYARFVLGSFNNGSIFDWKQYVPKYLAVGTNKAPLTGAPGTETAVNFTDISLFHEINDCDVTGEPIEHNRIKRKILAKLDSFFNGSKCEPFDEQIEVIFQNKDELYKYKPDIFVMCENATRKGESFTSVPKIIFEVVSKSTASHDYITKLAVYQKFKVEEYNIVEQSGKIIQYSLVDNQYIIADVYKNDDEYVSTVFNDLKISLKEIY